MYSPIALLAKKFLAPDFENEPSNTRAEGIDSAICVSSAREPSEININTSKCRYVWSARDRTQMFRSSGSASGASGKVTDTRGLWSAFLAMKGVMLAHDEVLCNAGEIDLAPTYETPGTQGNS